MSPSDRRPPGHLRPVELDGAQAPSPVSLAPGRHRTSSGGHRRSAQRTAAPTESPAAAGAGLRRRWPKRMMAVFAQNLRRGRHASPS